MGYFRAGHRAVATVLQQPRAAQRPEETLEFDLYVTITTKYVINGSNDRTQLTTGGKREAEIATPISGPTAPCSKATATPVPDVNAHKTPIQRERALPLFKKIAIIFLIFVLAYFCIPTQDSPPFHFFGGPVAKAPRHFGGAKNETENQAENQRDQHTHSQRYETAFLQCIRSRFFEIVHSFSVTPDIHHSNIQSTLGQRS